MVKLCAISSIKIRLPRLFYGFAFQIEVDQSRFEDLNQVQAFLFLLRILSLSCIATLADHFKRFLLIKVDFDPLLICFHFWFSRRIRPLRSIRVGLRS
jgi:hypothetical protein